LFVCDQTYLTILDRSKRMPSTYTKIFKNTSNNNKQQLMSPIHICKQFKYILYLDMIEENNEKNKKQQLFVVEFTPSMIEQSLPPSLKRKRFGT